MALSLDHGLDNALRFGEIKGFDINRLLRRLAKILAVFLPTFAGIAYIGFIAADQYVSEAKFIVRSAEKPDAQGGLGALLQTGIGRSQDDTYAVAEFITSRDAVHQLSNSLPLLEIYGRPEADVLARYPSILYGRTEEELHAYLKRMISVIYTSSTGITTLSVRAFRANDAKSIAEHLLALSEELINRMNKRMQEDSVAISVAEVNRSQERLIEAQIAISKFRNDELMVDPTKSAVLLTELISKLSVELAQARSQLSEAIASSPIGGQIAPLKRRITALEEQIAFERRRITSASDGLAEKISEYERLNLRRDFANRALTSAETELTRARAEARRQHLYLEKIVLPSATDYPTEPRRLSIILTVFSANVILLLVGWLLVTGVREHTAGT
ncbi:MAG: CtrB-like MPA2 protein component of capsule polysaccharide exporter [Xanthobacteraceae bacterium]|nr:MAG: CtrB-like MPA2 protein component of capsule polysaccharide exporter [Xanthobacteraceae bacterium]